VQLLYEFASGDGKLQHAKGGRTVSVRDDRDTLGPELVRERQRLEKEQPEIATTYRSFLRDFAQFREMQKQLDHEIQAGPFQRAAFAARLK
jgi:hypothetical protein